MSLPVKIDLFQQKIMFIEILIRSSEFLIENFHCIFYSSLEGLFFILSDDSGNLW